MPWTRPPWLDPFGDLPMPAPWSGDPPAEIARRRDPIVERRLLAELCEARGAFHEAFGAWVQGKAGPLGEEERCWLADPDRRRTRLRDLLEASWAIAEAIEEDRRLAREAFRLLVRVAQRGEAGARDGLAVAFRQLLFAHVGLARLPLVRTPSQHVVIFLAGDGCPAELIGWPPGAPDRWEIRSNLFTLLEGRGFEAGADRLRLCRTPESWWRAGGEASAAVCVLDATDFRACCLIRGAAELVCDDDAHAAAVQAWLKAQRPKPPKLLVAAAPSAAGSV